jgi:DNA-binding NarL/FixJ family response regulator
MKETVMRRSRLLLADDHEIVAEGLRALLAPDYDIIGTARDGPTLVEAARLLKPDVIVADMDMPGLTGLDALRQLRAEKNDVKFVFLTVYGDAELAADAFRAGGAGYVLKHAASDELSTAIQEVLRGRLYLTPRIAKDVLTALASPAPEDPGKLTPRQRDVLRLIAEGHRMKKIAADLNLSTRTVESYKYALMAELGLASTADLVRYAIKHGLIAH